MNLIYFRVLVIIFFLPKKVFKPKYPRITYLHNFFILAVWFGNTVMGSMTLFVYLCLYPYIPTLKNPWLGSNLIFSTLFENNTEKLPKITRKHNDTYVTYILTQQEKYTFLGN